MRLASVWRALLLLQPLEVFCGTRIRKDQVTLSYEELLAQTSRQRETIASLRRENRQLRAQLAHGCPASLTSQSFGDQSRPRRLDQDIHPKCFGVAVGLEQKIILDSQEAVEDLGQYGCPELFGEHKAGRLNVTGAVEDLRPLGSVQRIFGDLQILDTNLTSLEGLNNLEKIVGVAEQWQGRIIIARNKALGKLDALQGLKKIRSLSIEHNDNLTTLPNLPNLTSVEALVIKGNSQLVGLDGLHIEEVRGSVEIKGNNMLEDLTGLVELKYVWAKFLIQDNNALKSLEGLGNLEIAGAVKVFNNTNMEYLGGLFNSNCDERCKMRWRSLEFVDEEGCHGAGDGNSSLTSSYPRCVTPNEWDRLARMDYIKDSISVTPEKLIKKCGQAADANQTNLDLWLHGACGPRLVRCLWKQPCLINFTKLGVNYKGDTYMPKCGSCGKCRLNDRPRWAPKDGTIDIYNRTGWEPGNYTLCRCGKSSMGPLMQIDLRGARIPVETTTCQKGMLCVVKGEFDRGAFDPSQIWLTTNDDDCSDQANSLVDGSFQPTYRNGSITLRPKEYRVCWKPEGDEYMGKPIHKVKIDGPNGGEGKLFPREADKRLEIVNAGDGVGSGNVMRLRLTTSESCDEQVAQLKAASVDNKFIFTASQLELGYYQQCWCHDSTTPYCVHVGSVKVTCPVNLVKSPTGTCELCSLGWEFDKRADEDPVCALDYRYWCIVGAQTLLLLWNFCLLLVVLGMPIRIQDTYTCSGLLYAASGYPHGFHMYGRKSFPVIFTDTKNRRLDSPKEPLRASSYMTQALRILKANGEQVTECWDTSRGFVRLPWYQELWHRGWPAPAGVLLVFNAICFVVLHAMDNQDPIHVACGAAGALVIALILRVINRLYCKSSHLTGLDKRLDDYRGLLLKKNPKPVACEKGPGRAIPLSELYCLLEFFAAWIRERNAYYMDTNILGPLTAPYKLSYAEVAGPEQVKWFVSHYWGNTFNDLCKTLRKHAELMTASARTSKMHGVDLWKDEAYWICFFSNNQYQLNDELGTGWDQSSFFLTLQSGYCQGVCLVLDTSAAPLTRAWCIFELLQTLLLEEKSTSCVKVGDHCFKGLHLCTEGGVLNEGQGSAEVTINLVERICRLDLEKADASSAQDKEMIHMQVEKSLGSFKKMNAKVRQKFDDLLKRAKHQQDSSYCDVYKQLHAALKDDACFHDERGEHHPVKGMEVALELKNSGDALVHPCSLRPPSGGHPGSGQDIRLEVPWPDPLNSSQVVQKQI